MNDSLLHRAIEVEAWIEDHMVDDYGVVYTLVDRTTGEALTNEVAQDRWVYSALIMDFDTGELRPIESRYFPRDDGDGTHLDNVCAPDSDQWAFFPFMTYLHSAKVSYSVLLARSGIAASRHFPREVTIRSMARRILKTFNIHNMTYYLHPDRLAPKFKYMTNLIAGDTVTHWLWGYWQGRGLGVLSESE